MRPEHKPVGRCSLCGGLVTIPMVWHGVQPPKATCEACGAVEDTSAKLPVIPTVKPLNVSVFRWLLRFDSGTQTMPVRRG